MGVTLKCLSDFWEIGANEPMQVYSVDEITAYIKNTLEGDFTLQNIWVRGEISSFKIPSRHLYFSLKDKISLLSCVMFQDKKQKLEFPLENGLEVIIRGNIGVYKPQGRYQLYVEEVFPVGRGLLYSQLEKLKKELKEKGYFSLEHKILLPFLPRRIGIVTSLDGAALRDILTTLNSRFPNLEITLAPCRVQGKEAAEEITRAINELNEYGKVDIIIVGRGGGSMEDLLAFNQKIVAEAIYNSKIPIISAVGHEIDLTISDLVADERAPTPTAAAERVVPKKDNLSSILNEAKIKLVRVLERQISRENKELKKLKRSLFLRHPEKRTRETKLTLDELRSRFSHLLKQRVRLDQARLSSSIQNLWQASPEKRIMLSQERLRRLSEKLSAWVKITFDREKQRIISLHHRMKDLSPLSILERGYSICFSYPEELIIRKAAQVRPGNSVKIKLYQGQIYSRVSKIEEEESEI